ncbi:MAG: signal peptidase I [Anaerolineae bacterium]
MDPQPDVPQWQEFESEAALRRAARRQRIGRLLREILETIVLTVVIFVGVRFAFQNFRIEGHSMEPTLDEGQFLVINKLIYRYLRPPQPGEVIVFRAPNNPNKDFIKRIIAGPGDEVMIREGLVIVNGEPLPEDYVINPGPPAWGPRVVGEDEYFVLGDNRSNSSDSRSWGMLPSEKIVGMAWLAYWPLESWGFVIHQSYGES